MWLSKNEAMTKWWLKLCIQTILLEHTILPVYSDATVCFLKGMTASSGACVGIGYYVASFIYNAYNSPPLSLQLYRSQNLEEFMSYPFYVVLDTMIHLFFTAFIFHFWNKHITIFNGISAFIFHRIWSIVNSNFTSIYFNGDEVYKIKIEPFWKWRVVYTGEALVIILVTGICHYYNVSH